MARLGARLCGRAESIIMSSDHTDNLDEGWLSGRWSAFRVSIELSAISQTWD
jgi:hypothetical protein